MKIFFATWIMAPDQRGDMERERVGQRLFSYYEVKEKQIQFHNILQEIINAFEQRNNC